MLNTEHILQQLAQQSRNVYHDSIPMQRSTKAEMQDLRKPKGRRGYAEDFKQRALNRLASGEVSLRQAAKEFKVSVPTLIKWRKEEAVVKGSLLDETLPAAAPPPRGRKRPTTELEMLREEVERLKHERDRLRLGIAILVGVKVSQ